MIPVRFFEGPFDRDDILHDTLLAAVPRVDETVTLRMPKNRSETTYKVLEVDYLLDFKEGISPADELTGVRIRVSQV